MLYPATGYVVGITKGFDALSELCRDLFKKSPRFSSGSVHYVTHTDFQ